MSVRLPICPSVRIEQLGSYWYDSHESLRLGIFRKYVERNEVLLKSDKNNRHFM